MMRCGSRKPLRDKIMACSPPGLGGNSKAVSAGRQPLVLCRHIAASKAAWFFSDYLFLRGICWLVCLFQDKCGVVGFFFWLLLVCF